ncbi:hypothetical protein CEXT_189061 [Caerostris extrusa]|uniref:Uncharacterized protein n=1 Tax=Caerostris extrusa TaxID=172846 RepID=A0AAV4X2J7_CAEEX|nr:hypothetical protein CEXT_189061 [Caerostris extrusa]
MSFSPSTKNKFELPDDMRDYFRSATNRRAELETKPRIIREGENHVRSVWNDNTFEPRTQRESFRFDSRELKPLLRLFNVQLKQKLTHRTI